MAFFFFKSLAPQNHLFDFDPASLNKRPASLSLQVSYHLTIRFAWRINK